MPFTADWLQAAFGRTRTGIATVGYRLFKNDGTDSVARTTVGVVEVGQGAYGVPNVTIPDDAVGIEWDTGGGAPLPAHESLIPYRLQYELQAKLPTNFLMGSSVQTDKDDEIDTILARTDVATSSRAAPGAAMDLVTDAVDADAVAATGAQEISTQVNADITTAHGAGSYQTATGFAVPGDAMALTPGERAAIDAQLSGTHGAGSWETAAAPVTTVGEYLDAELAGDPAFETELSVDSAFEVELVDE